MTPERTKKFERVVRARQLNLTVILENVHDPHNLGAVLRTCDAVGIKEIFLLYTEPDAMPEELNIGKHTSTGARKWVDVHLYEDINACFEYVRERYGKIYSTHLSEDAVSLYELDLSQSVALLFGNERDGLSKAALEHSDGNFIIPMQGMVQSLNISVACAVSLYEAMRQRNIKGYYDESPVSSESERKELMTEYLRRHEVRWTGRGFINIRED